MNKVKIWLFLAAAIAFEVTGSLSMKAGLDHPAWYILTVIGYAGAFTFIIFVLRLGMPLGVSYGIWAASGVALTAIFSMLIFGEPLTLMMIGGIVLIILGVLAVELGSHTTHQKQETR